MAVYNNPLSSLAVRAQLVKQGTNVLTGKGFDSAAMKRTVNQVVKNTVRVSVDRGVNRATNKIKNPIIRGIVKGVVRDLANRTLSALFKGLFGTNAAKRYKFDKYKPKNITQGFLYDTITDEKLAFQFNPNELTLKRNPKYAEVSIPGMSHPKQQWIHGGSRKVTFKLDLWYSLGRLEVIKAIDWMESLTYPDYEGGNNMKRGAHPVLFNFGDTFKNMKCFVTDFSVKMYDMFDPVTLLPLKAEVTLELSEVLLEDEMDTQTPGLWKFTTVDYRDVRNRHG